MDKTSILPVAKGVAIAAVLSALGVPGMSAEWWAALIVLSAIANI